MTEQEPPKHALEGPAAGELPPVADHDVAAPDLAAGAVGTVSEPHVPETAVAVVPEGTSMPRGATGERRVVEELAQLDAGWTVLHDRLLHPGQSMTNLDHVVVGPGGILLIDAKNRAGRIERAHDGLVMRMSQGGYRQTVNLAGELARTCGLAAHMSAELAHTVTPVYCLAGAQEASFGEPTLVRGAWVVPVSRLVEWLEAMPETLPVEVRDHVATRVMTQFPSTSTDPELLAAIGQAAAAKGKRRHRVRDLVTPRRSAPPVAAAGRRSGDQTWAEPGATAPQGGSAAANRAGAASAPHPKRAVRLVAGLAAVAALVGLGAATLPSLLGSVFVPVSATPLGAQTPVSVLDCNAVGADQVASVVGRRLEPVATTDGCAWGTRLDDPDTVVVRIETGPAGAASDPRWATSRAQHRAVYGTAVDADLKPATALWVAQGEPIGEAGVADAPIALGDIHVVVSRSMLKVADDAARTLALDLARLANDKP